MARRASSRGVGWRLVAALALGASVSAGWPVWRAAREAWHASAEAATVTLQPARVDPAWIREGRPRFQNAEIARSPGGHGVTGVWVCDGPTRFEWHFELDETVYVLEGRVEIRYLGRSFALEPGQSAVFKAGTTAEWHVPNHLKKVFVLHDPGRLVRAWNALRQRLDQNRK